MSTIVVVRKNNQVCIAAESLTSFGDTKLSATYDKYHNKIQQFGETYLGIVGSAAHSIVLENALTEEFKDFNFDSRENIFKTFLELHPVLKEKYFLKPKSDDDDPYESSQIDAVLANSNGIFAVYGLRDVNEFEKFWAVGSGGDYAIGAMYAVYDKLDSAEAIAKVGVEAGAEFDNASALPLTYKTIELK